MSKLENIEAEKGVNYDPALEFIGTKEIARYMGCSLPVARQIMHRKDFPLIKCGKNLRVMRKKFEEWASERRL